MPHRTRIIRLCLGVAAVTIVPRGAAYGMKSRTGHSMWQLPSPTYPAHASVHHSTANDYAQRMLGIVHHRSYDELGRFDGYGWVQSATVTHFTGKHHHGRHVLHWAYAVSYYGDSALAQRAVADITLPLHGLGDNAEKTSVLVNGTQSGTYAAISQGSIAVEQTCSMATRDAKRYRSQLETYCSRQWEALVQILDRAAPPTLTSSPTPTSSPTATATSIPTTTQTPTTTLSPTSTAAPMVPALPPMLASPTDTATPTGVALATTAPVIAATDTPTAGPAPTVQPSQAVQVSAGVSNPTPHDNSTETVFGQITVNGQGVAGVPMATTWYYKSTTVGCSGVTDTAGAASCSRDISRATYGYTVQVAVIFTYQGQTYNAGTSFTPE